MTITHATQGTQNLTADGPGEGTEDDPYVFTSAVTHSDTVEFETGFAAPIGEFCIVVNDGGDADAIDPTGCAVIDAPAAGILDTSGTYQAQAAGIPVEYELQLTPKGRITGIAGADLAGDASFETPGAAQGLFGRGASLEAHHRALAGQQDHAVDVCEQRTGFAQRHGVPPGCTRKVQQGGLQAPPLRWCHGFEACEALRVGSMRVPVGGGAVLATGRGARAASRPVCA